MVAWVVKKFIVLHLKNQTKRYKLHHAGVITNSKSICQVLKGIPFQTWSHCWVKGVRV